MDKGNWLDEDFTAPLSLETPRYRLRKLTLEDAVKDYDAVMTSVDHLCGVFGPGDNWPAATLSLHEDMVDLGWHQKEFEIGRSFAYTVVTLDETKCLGCVYVYPCDIGDFQAKVFCWVRASEADTGLDENLYQTVRSWISEHWPLTSVAYPGRETAWVDWQALS